MTEEDQVKTSNLTGHLSDLPFSLCARLAGGLNELGQKAVVGQMRDGRDGTG